MLKKGTPASPRRFTPLKAPGPAIHLKSGEAPGPAPLSASTGSIKPAAQFTLHFSSGSLKINFVEFGKIDIFLASVYA